MTASEFSVNITDIALPNDYGVAKKDGLVIFIPGAVIGDRVTVKIGRENKRFAYGQITRIDVPSRHRIPRHVLFWLCGQMHSATTAVRQTAGNQTKIFVGKLEPHRGIRLESIETFRLNHP